MSWEEATERWAELAGTKEGFYLSHQVRNGKQTAVLASAVNPTNKSGKKEEKSKKDAMYTLFRPNTGLQVNKLMLDLNSTPEHALGKNTVCDRSKGKCCIAGNYCITSAML